MERNGEGLSPVDELVKKHVGEDATATGDTGSNLEMMLRLPMLSLSRYRDWTTVATDVSGPNGYTLPPTFSPGPPARDHCWICIVL